MDPNGPKPPQNKNVPQDQYNPGNDNDSGGIGVLISQDMILPGAIKPRHLQKSDTLAEGDTYYVDSNGNFARLGIGATGSIMDVSSGIPAWLPIGSTDQVLTVSGGAPAWSTLTTARTDGWIDDTAHTWTYASASTFTIAGVDLTTTFTKGTFLKFTQTTVKYAVVLSSSFSTDTTVTIAVNTDYTIANAAITANYYSYEANPQGYPGWFAYTPTLGGFSADPASGKYRFNVIGRQCFLTVQQPSDGTSNATSFTISTPVTSAANSNNSGSGQGVDNGAVPTTPVLLSITANSSTINLYKDWSGASWTNSGNKRVVFGQIQYEI